MSEPKLPSPCADGRCSYQCPHFYWDRMPGWPSAQACFVWDDTLDGKEPLYLTDSECKPALRLGREPVMVQLDLPLPP